MFTTPPERLVKLRLEWLTFDPLGRFSVPLLFQFLLTGFTPPAPTVVVPAVSSVPVPVMVALPDQLKALLKVNVLAEVNVPPLRFTTGPPAAKVCAAPNVCVPPVKFRLPVPV